MRVLPRAKRNEIVELLSDGTLKVRLTAPPVGGKANQALIKFLSKLLGVAKSKIEIRSGATSRNKLISVKGIDAHEVREKIKAALST